MRERGSEGTRRRRGGTARGDGEADDPHGTTNTDQHPPTADASDRSRGVWGVRCIVGTRGGNGEARGGRE